MINFILSWTGYYVGQVNYKFHIFKAVVLCFVWACSSNCYQYMCAEILVEMKGVVRRNR